MAVNSRGAPPLPAAGPKKRERSLPTCVRAASVPPACSNQRRRADVSNRGVLSRTSTRGSAGRTTATPRGSSDTGPPRDSRSRHSKRPTADGAGPLIWNAVPPSRAAGGVAASTVEPSGATSVSPAVPPGGRPSTRPWSASGSPRGNSRGQRRKVMAGDDPPEGAGGWNRTRSPRSAARSPGARPSPYTWSVRTDGSRRRKARTSGSTTASGGAAAPVAGKVYARAAGVWGAYAPGV